MAMTKAAIAIVRVFMCAPVVWVTPGAVFRPSGAGTSLPRIGTF